MSSTKDIFPVNYAVYKNIFTMFSDIKSNTGNATLFTSPGLIIHSKQIKNHAIKSAPGNNTFPTVIYLRHKASATKHYNQEIEAGFYITSSRCGYKIIQQSVCVYYFITMSQPMFNLTPYAFLKRCIYSF